MLEMTVKQMMREEIDAAIEVYLETPPLRRNDGGSPPYHRTQSYRDALLRIQKTESFEHYSTNHNDMQAISDVRLMVALLRSVAERLGDA